MSEKMGVYEAAEAVGVSPELVRRAVKLGKLKAEKDELGKYRFKLSDLRKWRDAENAKKA